MKKVLLFSLLLILGLIGSQLLPMLEFCYIPCIRVINFLTMTCLAFIMIHVGFDFAIDKYNIKTYGWDYIVAATAAAFPWIFCALYFIYFIPYTGNGSWREAFFAARFTSPTSAGILLSMLAAAGLGASWLFQKARILAIFDDLDTILFMVPLRIALMGFHWEQIIIVVVTIFLIWLAWRYLHAIRMPVTWPWVFTYSIILTISTEIWHHLPLGITPLHISVLLPAFVLGCVATPRRLPTEQMKRRKKFVRTIVSACFMAFVGLSTPPFLFRLFRHIPTVDVPNVFSNIYEQTLSGIHESASIELGWKAIAFHVVMITILSNLGKMFPAFCYRDRPIRERLALAIGMFPRGEVGAGIIALSIAVGISGPMIIIATLSLSLNLILTGVFISIIKLLQPTTIHYL